MKKYIFILLVFNTTASLFGQDFIPYQLVLRDAAGNPIYDFKNVTVTITDDGSDRIYSESFSSTELQPSVNGYVISIPLGKQNPVQFAQIDWSLGGYLISTTIETLDGDVLEFPAQPIGSTPRSFFAQKAEEAKRVEALELEFDSIAGKWILSDGTGHIYSQVENPYWFSVPTASDKAVGTEYNVTIGTPLNNQYPTNLGGLTIFNNNGADFYNANNQRYISIDFNPTVNIGEIRTYYPNGSPAIVNSANTANVAGQFVYGPNGNLNFSVSSLSGSPNNGFITLNNDQGAAEVSIYVAANGQGTVAADVKNFRMEHPTQPGKEIWYASVEGPEAAAYTRGTAKLENGQVKVAFPEHFSLVANATTMTVILTALSADSRGLAVIEKGETGFVVKELHGGTGSYEFDWEVKAVRKGYEDYRVIRDAKEAMPAEPIKQDKF